MALPIPPASFKTTLTNKIDETITTIKIDAVVDDDSNSLDTLELYFVIDKGKSTEEFIKGTVDASNFQLTSVVRDIDVLNPTSSTGTGSVHRKKSSIEITAYPYLTLALRALNGTDEMGGVMQLPSARTINTSRDVTDKEYVDAATAAAGGITSFMTTDAGGLDIDISSGYYATDDGIVEYAGVAGQTLTDNATNYVMLDTDGTLVVDTTGWIASHTSIAKVITLSGDITSITDARSWITSPSADRLITDDIVYGEDISAGDAVYLKTSDGKWWLADASSGNTSFTTFGIAIDSGVASSTGNRVQIGGLVDGLSLSGFNYVYIGNTPGAISSTVGTYRKVIGYALSTSRMLLLPTLGIDATAGANSDVTLNNLNELCTLIANTDITGAELETLSDLSTADSLHVHLLNTLLRLDIQNNNRALIVGGAGDALTETVTGAGVVTRDWAQTTLQTGTTSGGDALIQNPIGANNSGNATYRIQWANSIDLDFDVAVQTNSAQDVLFGLHKDAGALTGVPNVAAITAEHVAFIIEDATLKASVADGTTQNTTTISGITLTNYNHYRISWDGTTATFYINGTQEAQITTNAPAASTNQMGLVFGIVTTNTADKFMFVMNNYIARVELPA